MRNICTHLKSVNCNLRESSGSTCQNAALLKLEYSNLQGNRIAAGWVAAWDGILCMCILIWILLAALAAYYRPWNACRGEKKTCSVKTAEICPRPKGMIGWARCQPQCQGKGRQSHQGCSMSQGTGTRPGCSVDRGPTVCFSALLMVFWCRFRLSLW